MANRFTNGRPKMNGKRLQSSNAEIWLCMRKSGPRNRTLVSKFSLNVHKYPFLLRRSENMAKIVLNPATSPKFEALNRKLSSRRTIAVTRRRPA